MTVALKTNVAAVPASIEADIAKAKAAPKPAPKRTRAPKPRTTGGVLVKQRDAIIRFADLMDKVDKSASDAKEVADNLHKAGVLAAWCYANQDAEKYETVKEIIASRLTNEERGMLAVQPGTKAYKDMSKEWAEQRNAVSRKVSQRVGNLGQQLAKREKEAAVKKQARDDLKAAKAAKDKAAIEAASEALKTGKAPDETPATDKALAKLNDAHKLLKNANRIDLTDAIEALNKVCVLLEKAGAVDKRNTR